MINELLQHTLAASRQLVTLDDATINRILIDTASALLTRLSFFQRTKKTSHGWTKMIRSTIG